MGDPARAGICSPRCRWQSQQGPVTCTSQGSRDAELAGEGAPCVGLAEHSPRDLRSAGWKLRAGLTLTLTLTLGRPPASLAPLVQVLISQRHPHRHPRKRLSQISAQPVARSGGRMQPTITSGQIILRSKPSSDFHFLGDESRGPRRGSVFPSMRPEHPRLTAAGPLLKASAPAFSPC